LRLDVLNFVFANGSTLVLKWQVKDSEDLKKLKHKIQLFEHANGMVNEYFRLNVSANTHYRDAFFVMGFVFLTS
jgi:hypothetical protein